MSEATPGPWKVAEENCGGGWNIVAPSGVRVAHTADSRAKDGTWNRAPQNRANAALIAAAPDLRDALRAAVAWEESCTRPPPAWLLSARAELALAEGGAR